MRKITIYNLIGRKVERWVELEKENNQSIIKILLGHIEKEGKLRPPQKEAIETYLWIKFAGENKKLSEMVKEGLLYDDFVAQEYDNYRNFGDNYATQFLNQFFQDNGLTNLHKKLVNDPNGEETDWHLLIDELLHNFDYSNYLFSLPMGAGKTFLMACFIYLDLYFATLFKNDNRFAHNFIVFAPQSSKTAILPSLKTIKDFNPEWVLPESDAEKIKQSITIEILDSLSSRRKDKLHGNNPNLEKVNRIKQSKNFGMVFITNAEKVVLEKYADSDKLLVESLNVGQKNLHDNRTIDEIKKTNELRNALSEIPNITVILDEVHHSYGITGSGEKKLRQAVNILNKNNNINAVIGLSGTPYVKSKVEVGGKNISLNQIQDIVYNYSLNMGIGKFLKRPVIKKVDVTEKAFLKQALADFFKDYDKMYKNGTQSKIVFYCPSIKKLNDDILPVVQEWYRVNRKSKEDEIFRYYSNVKKEHKQYRLPKENLAIFNNLDKPYSKKRVILLVAVGTEGWDCKSLTSVVLPRQETTKNFVLQTTCRCLREVDDAANEKALIYLSVDNYATLDKELHDNYQLSVSDLTNEKSQTIKVQVRKPKLGKLNYKQIDTKYKIVKKSSPEIKQALTSFEFSKIESKYYYDKSIVESNIGRAGLTGESTRKGISENTNPSFSFSHFLHLLTDYTYGFMNESEMEMKYLSELDQVYRQIKGKTEWIALNPHIDMEYIIKSIAQGIMGRIEYIKEVIETETKIELLEWQGSDNQMNLISPDGSVYKFMPRISEGDARTYQRHPEDLIEDNLSDKNNIDPQDISFNYVPYKMDSTFEQNALQEMLKLAELKDLEVYFNGYKNEKLQTFWIQTPRGRYTPDFLILKRKDGKKYNKKKTIAIEKAIIIETKGRLYYNEEFKAKEKFVKEEFLKHNKHFTYLCFVDEGKNDFTKHLTTFKQRLQNF